MVKSNVYGECAKHPGNNMVNCVSCSMENDKINTKELLKFVPTKNELHILSKIDKADSQQFRQWYHHSTMISLESKKLITSDSSGKITVTERGKSIIKLQ